MNRDEVYLPVYSWRRGWTTLFTLNLIIPVTFGMIATAQGGTIGMLIGAVTLWGLGLLIGSRLHLLDRPMYVGGTAVGMMQSIPIFHILAGKSALETWAHHAPNEDFFAAYALSELGGFVVTLLTGTYLILAALTSGIVIRWLYIVFCTGWRPENATGIDQRG